MCDCGCGCVCVHTAQTTRIKFQVTFQYQQEWHFSVLIMTFYHSHFFDLMAAGERSQWMANREQVEEANVFCELKKYSPSNWDLTYCLSLSFFHRQFLIPVLITFFFAAVQDHFHAVRVHVTTISAISHFNKQVSCWKLIHLVFLNTSNNEFITIISKGAHSNDNCIG